VIARNRSLGALDHQRRDLHSIKLSYLTEDRAASTITIIVGPHMDTNEQITSPPLFMEPSRQAPAHQSTIQPTKAPSHPNPHPL
jgi:hypothetical protein